MKNIKQKLLKILNEKGKKNYTKALKNEPILLNFLEKKYGNLPLSELFYLGIHNINPYCKYGKKKSFKSINDGYRPFCGVGKKCQCRQENQSLKIKKIWQNKSDIEKKKLWQKYKQTMIEKYGVDNPIFSTKIKEKIIKTNLKKYNAKTPFESEVIKSKIKKTNIEKYGVEYPLQNQQIYNKCKETYIKKYGSLMIHARIKLFEKYNGNPFSNPQIQEKIKQTLQKKYNITYFKHYHIDYNTLKILKDKNQFKNYLNKYQSSSIMAKKLNIDVSTIQRYINKYNLNFPLQKKSSRELELYNFISNDLKIKAKSSFKIEILNKKREIDIFIPEYNLAIEYCGLYWHSENKRKNKNYHYDKWKYCKDLNIQLLTIFEDEYLKNSNIIKSTIKNKLKLSKRSIPGRKMIIKEISIQEANKFLKKYHIQGIITKNTISLGSFYNDILFGVMCFYELSSQKYDLTRFCGDGDIHNGMASKLFKYFIKNYNPKIVISFADLRWSNGNLYYQLGFKLDKILEPTYYYTDYKKRWHKSSFMKNKIRKKFNLDNNYKFTEKQIMSDYGYDRIWDCGKLRFIWTNKKE